MLPSIVLLALSLQVLLSHSQEGEDEVDLLNMHTYDFYDWFIYVFCLSTFGCCCSCIGWCSHKSYIKNKIVDDKDVNELATPIALTPSPPDHKGGSSNMFRFGGFTIFGDAAPAKPKPTIIRTGNAIKAVHMKLDSTTATPSQLHPQIGSSLQMTPMVLLPPNKTPDDHSSSHNYNKQMLQFSIGNSSIHMANSSVGNSSVASSVNSKSPNITPKPQKPLMDLSDHTLDVIKHEEKSTPRLSFKLRHEKIQLQLTNQNSGTTENSTFTPGVASPDSNIVSESHVSINIPMGTPIDTPLTGDSDDDDLDNYNPYAQIVDQLKLNVVNEDVDLDNEDDDVKIDKIVTPIPPKMLSLDLPIIDEEDDQ